MNKNLKNLLKYLIELLIVAFGVFLGMYVGEWKEKRELEKKVDQSLQLMTAELRENRKSLEVAVAYHKKLRKEIENISKGIGTEERMEKLVLSDAFELGDMKSWKGIRLPDLEDVAFESAKINGTLAEMPFNQIKALSQIHKVIDLQVDYGETLLNQLLAINSETRVLDLLRTINLLTHEYANLEEKLMVKLDKIIESLESK